MLNVGLTMRVDLTAHGEIREGLDVTWPALLRKIGVRPVLLSSFAGSAEDLLSMHGLSCVILTGGNDVIETGPTYCPERNAFERDLMRACINQGLRVVGICRGMQMINLFFGGTVAPLEGHVGQNHIVSYNGYNLMVNSYHNYAIHRLGDGLFSTSVDESGHVESFTHESYLWHGVMWHPERSIEHADWHLNWLKKAVGENL